MLIMITYDLNKIKDYEKLYEAIGNLGTTHRDPDLDSVWFVYTNYTIKQVEDYLLANIDEDDRIFLCQVNPNQFAGYLKADVWDWIRTSV